MSVSAYNNFTFIGMCYSDAECTVDSRGNKRCKFIVCVKSPKKREINHLPILAFNAIGEKAMFYCRNGAKIAVSGHIVTSEYVDRTNAEIKIRAHFVATEIIRIEKPVRSKISLRKYANLLDIALIEENDMPVEKK